TVRRGHHDRFPADAVLGELPGRVPEIESLDRKTTAFTREEHLITSEVIRQSQRLLDRTDRKHRASTGIQRLDDGSRGAQNIENDHRAPGERRSGDFAGGHEYIQPHAASTFSSTILSRN